LSISTGKNTLLPIFAVRRKNTALCTANRRSIRHMCIHTAY